jgi:uncharacterized membrane protein
MRGSALRERFATSLWLLPTVTAVVAFWAAKGLCSLDRTIPQNKRAWYLFGGHPENARELLSTVAGSVMSLTGVVFSVTIIVLQLASSQFTPRVLRTFLEDRLTRTSLAIFIGAFVFPMAVLPEVSNDPEFVPAMAVFVAFGLALVSVLVFARYIHHMAHSIRVVNVIGRVAVDTRASLEKMFPPRADGAREPAAEAPMPAPGAAHLVRHERKAGVIAHVDHERLLSVAVRLNLVVELIPRLGDFVPQNAPLFRVWGECPPAFPRAVRDCVSITSERTQHQDPAFGLRQLVDIAERALSPGVNDPTTAIQVLDVIHDLLRTLATRSFPPVVVTDGSGRARIVVRGLTWAGYVHLGFDEIRQYGQSSLQVLRRLRIAIEDLLTVASDERLAVLRRQLLLLDQALATGFPSAEERDLARATNPAVQPL